MVVLLRLKSTPARPPTRTHGEKWRVTCCNGKGVIGTLCSLGSVMETQAIEHKVASFMAFRVGTWAWPRSTRYYHVYFSVAQYSFIMESWALGECDRQTPLINLYSCTDKSRIMPKGSLSCIGSLSYESLSFCRCPGVLRYSSMVHVRVRQSQSYCLLLNIQKY